MQALRGLRVAYLAFERLPNNKGSGRRIGQMSRALLEAGAELHLIGLGQAKEPPFTHPGLHFHPIKLLEDNYLERGLAFRRRAQDKLYGLKPEVIHYRGIFEGQAALKHQQSHSCRTIFEVNGLPSIELSYHYPALRENRRLQGKLRDVESEVLEASNALMTQSGATQSFVQHRCLTERTIEVIPNGAHPSWARLTKPDWQKTPQLLYVGSLAPWQGLQDVISSLKKLHKHHDFRLKVVGPGRKAWLKYLHQLTRQYKVDGLVEFLGEVSPDSLPEVIEESHICLAPLRRDLRNRIQGCSPIKVFEYMMAGRPTLSTQLPCVREIIQHQEDGLLVSANRSHRIYQGLQELLSNPEYAQQLGNSAQKRALQQFSWAGRQQQLVEFYGRVLTE